MCRIFGFIDKQIAPEKGKKLLQNMSQSLAHGGPDQQGSYTANALYLGHRRLSILDVSTAGKQPMFWQNQVVVYNGEIYNFKEIRRELKSYGYQFSTATDTEVLLKAYEKWGYDCVQKFRGMFAFALWDKTKKELILCRDRVGVKPLYWYWKDGLFMFASELKAFHQHPKFDKSISPSAVSLYLQQGYIQAPHCIFKYAHKLEPGCFLCFDAQANIKKFRYWDIESIHKKSQLDQRTEMEITEELENILSESFNYRMVSDVPVGMFLSGGIDSSLVTALIQKQSNQQVNTFTIGFSDKGDEAPYAQAIAKHIGTNHHELYCTPAHFKAIIPRMVEMYDEPFGDSSGIPTFLVSQLAREKVKVSLSADGGDELFGGYTKYEIAKKYYPFTRYLPSFSKKLFGKLNFQRLEKYQANLPFLKNYTGIANKCQKFSNAIQTDNLIDFFNVASTYLTKAEAQSFTTSYTNRYIYPKGNTIPKNQLLSLLGMIDIKTYLEGDILTKVDRATMQVGLEGREPFLDQHIIEFAQCIPDHLKIKGKATKYLLRKILYKYVPKELIDRPKQGFSAPIGNWLKTHLHADLKKIIADESFFQDLQLSQRVKEVLTNFLSNRKYVNPQLVWFIFTLHQWYNRWIRNSSIRSPIEKPALQLQQ